MLAALLVAVSVYGCADDGPDGAADAATTTAAATADLPPEPRVLFEWFPAGEDTKSIIVSDAELVSPPIRVVPRAEGDAVHASWSSDGTQFTWEVLVHGGTSGNLDDTASVWTANADGSDPVERVTCPGPPCVEMSYPAFSPDDRQLLVTRYDLDDGGGWGPSHLVVVDLASGEQTVIASTADGSSSFYSASWSPDGTQVAAALETYGDSTQADRSAAGIVVVDTDPTTDDEPIPVTAAELFGGYPRWHPTEDRILFASFDLDAFGGAEPSQLYTVAPDGSGLVQITHVDHATTNRRPGEASWTPDGERIIAAVGLVQDARVVDVRIAFVDPATGAITETDASGAMPTLQP
jgi:Tol biopolymer transport system component